MSVFFDILIHVISTLLLSVFIYNATGDWFSVFIFVLGGIFIDLDHLIDYFAYQSKFRLSDSLNSAHLDSGKVYVFFHSWEVNILILVLSLASHSKALFLLFAGMSIHVAIDNVQRKNVFFYFLIYRLAKNFQVSALLPERKAIAP